MKTKIKYNENVQKLFDIMDARECVRYLRIKDDEGNEYICRPDCWTYVTIGDNEDVDALRFIIKGGGEVTLAGQWIVEWAPYEEDKKNN